MRIFSNCFCYFYSLWYLLTTLWSNKQHCCRCSEICRYKTTCGTTIAWKITPCCASCCIQSVKCEGKGRTESESGCEMWLWGIKECGRCVNKAVVLERQKLHEVFLAQSLGVIYSMQSGLPLHSAESQRIPAEPGWKQVKWIIQRGCGYTDLVHNTLYPVCSTPCRLGNGIAKQLTKCKRVCVSVAFWGTCADIVRFAGVFDVFPTVVCAAHLQWSLRAE